MPSYENVQGYVRKAYNSQQETLHMMESQLGEWQKHVTGTLQGQRAARVWVDTMVGLLRNLVALSEDLGSMRRLLKTLASIEARKKPSGSL